MELKITIATFIIIIIILYFESINQNTWKTRNKKKIIYQNISYVFFILNMFILMINIYHASLLRKADKQSLGFKLIIILFQLWIVRVQLQGYYRR